MSKKHSKIDKRFRYRQISLMDAIAQLHEERIDCREQYGGDLNISEKLRQSLNRAIKNSGKSRYKIAGEISHLVGRQITKAMLDSWTAESKPNRPPADILPSFCKVTSCTEPLEILNEATGIFGMPGPDVLRAEIQRLDEQEKQLRAAKRKRVMFLKEIETKNMKL